MLSRDAVSEYRMFYTASDAWFALCEPNKNHAQPASAFYISAFACGNSLCLFLTKGAIRGSESFWENTIELNDFQLSETQWECFTVFFHYTSID